MKMKKIKIIVDDQEVYTVPGKTIMEAVHENNITEIPSLCYDKRIEPYGSCYLCVVEVEGMNKLVPSCATPVREGMVITTDNENIRSSRKAALELILSNHYADCIGPCKNNCPAGVDVQGYVSLISMGKNREALKLIKENNPLPMTIGRVCVRDCEVACRRQLVDEPVAINAMKRYVADIDNTAWKPKLKKSRNKNIAVIGGGPSGLTCAYYLTVEGYKVTIFEKLPELGGMLRYGIPAYRLPRNVLDKEIDWITDLGVDVKTGVEMGKDLSVKKLLNNGFDSVYLAVGAHKASSMRLENENTIKGVVKGIDFLREISMNGSSKLHGTVIIVGGGNTAIDAARTSLRCGAGKVQIVYRRSIKEMPAHEEEINAAQKEGVEIIFLTNPKSIIEKKNVLTGIECLKMELVDAGEGQRPKPVPIEGSEYVLSCDMLISAIGQEVDTSFVTTDKNCELNKWGNIIVDDNTLETSIPGVFAGGDVVTGPYTAVSSIAYGKKAAQSIHEYITQKKISGNGKPFLSFKHNLAEISDSEFEHIEKVSREKIKEIPLNKRLNGFKEVEQGLTKKQISVESLRCLECGCSEYSDCILRKYADEFGIEIPAYIGETKKYKIDDRHPLITLDPNKCINCGKCVRTCSEILKVAALGFVNRGFTSVVKPAMEKALAETNCIACGNCIDVCPTGAITQKLPYRSLGTLKKYNKESICHFCSLGCKVNYKIIANDIFHVSNSTKEIVESHNKGYLCIKGRFGHQYLLEKNRLEKPVIRSETKTSEVKWDEALNYTTDKIKKIIKNYGPGSVALFASPKLTNEELYLLQKFARTTIGTNNIDSFSNLFNDVKNDDLDEMPAIRISTATLDEIQNTDVIIAINSGINEENLVAELKIKEAKKNGAKLIYINSSETRLTKYADLWIDTNKGTNTVLINGIINKIINEKAYNKKFISEKTVGFDKLKDNVFVYNDDEVCGITNINKETYYKLYEILKDPQTNILFLYNPDSLREKSVNDLQAITNFLLLTGRIIKKNNGTILLRDYVNSTGSLDMGISPYYLPGYVKYDDKKEIENIGKAWNANLENVFIPTDIQHNLISKNIKALLIFGEDPLCYEENMKYFRDIEFTMTHDMFNTDTASYSNVVLPARSYLEKNGTFTTCDRRVQKISKIFNSPKIPDIREIIAALSSGIAGNMNIIPPANILYEIKKVNRCYNKSKGNYISGRELLKNIYFTKNNKAGFSVYDMDISVSNTKKKIMLYSENYYLNKIKKKLT